MWKKVLLTILNPAELIMELLLVFPGNSFDSARCGGIRGPGGGFPALMLYHTGMVQHEMAVSMMQMPVCAKC